MLEHKVDVKQALRAYQKVVDEGIRKGDKYILSGVSAWSDHDGYSVSLGFGKVTLQIFFHQRFSLEAENRIEAALFLEKLDRVVQS